MPEVTSDLLPVVGRRMAPVVRALQVFAQHDETLLLRGTTGSGKSRMAHWVHSVSHRASGPFELVDLNAIPAPLQLAELFGWRRGAFTGALASHPGAVHRAGSGTLFIDEIDKLDLRAQASMLRLVEDGHYRVLGDPVEQRANVRFIFGTNGDLEAQIAEGRFLRDLYYRINVLPVRIPSLAERKDEIPAWARHMLERMSPAPALVVADGTFDALLEHDWPGNLRQLDNVIKRAVALVRIDGPGATLERKHIELALRMDEDGQGQRPRAREPWDTLVNAVDALLVAVEQAHEMGEPLALKELVSGLRAMILVRAVERGASVEDALHMLDLDSLVRGRNHQRSLHNATQKLAEFERQLSRRSKLASATDAGPVSS